MYRILLYSALLFAGVGSSGCSTSKHSTPKRLPGVWQATPITVDGDSKDWPAPYPEYDSKASLGYAVSNDKDNLYITVETGDQATQLKILRNGLTVWIDKTGEKDEKTAINYPLPRHYNRNARTEGEQDDSRAAGGHWVAGSGDNSARQRANMEDRIKLLIVGANEYSLQGFRACNAQFPLLQKDSCGIEVRMALDETNELVWEAVIPFRAFYYKAQIENRDKGKAMSICIETTGTDRPAGQGNGGRNGGMRPSMGMGFGGMGMGMRMGGGGMGGNRGYGSNNSAQSAAMENLYKSTKTWKKFGIAWQNTSPNP